MKEKINMIKSNKNKGFTLVELIVVIVIILILGAVLVPNVLRYVSKAQAAACAENRHSILLELTASYTNGEYPTVEDAFKGVIAQHEKTCPGNGTYSLISSNESAPRIVCDIHSATETPDNPDTGGTHSGYTIETNSEVVKNFFENNWTSEVEQNEGNELPYKYKTFEYNGKKYCLVFSEKNISTAVEDTIKYSGEYIMAEQGKLGNEKYLEILSGYLNTDKQIKYISLKDGTITLTYKNE